MLKKTLLFWGFIQEEGEARAKLFFPGLFFPSKWYCFSWFIIDVVFFPLITNALIVLNIEGGRY